MSESYDPLLPVLSLIAPALGHIEANLGWGTEDVLLHGVLAPLSGSHLFMCVRWSVTPVPDSCPPPSHGIPVKEVLAQVDVQAVDLCQMSKALS